MKHLEYVPFDHPAMCTPCVWHSSAPRIGDYVVLLLRRRFRADADMPPIRLWASASQRYILYLDGREVSRGPSRGSEQCWSVAPVDLPALPAGGHVISAVVWHIGAHAGEGQLGRDGFFLLAADDPNHPLAKHVRTSDAWRCVRDESRSPVTEHPWQGGRRYCVVGSGEQIKAESHPWGWREVEFDDSDWPAARVVVSQARDPWGNIPLAHRLVFDPLPQMQQRPDRFTRVALCEGVETPAVENLIERDEPLLIPPESSVRLLLDRGELTNAFLNISTSGGSGASIETVSCEALRLPGSQSKGNRDEVEGKVVVGHRDVFIPDGGPERRFEPLWFRPFRYLEVSVHTADEPLELTALTCRFTGFPLSREAKISVPGRDDIAAIGDIDWRTIRLCAHETFFDCPHYEQCQFVGDSRIQAIYHYLVADEDRLARKCLRDFHVARTADGLVPSRTPSRRCQLIPTFSLLWICMLGDFLRYRGDREFVGSLLPLGREILQWFLSRRRSDGLLGLVPYAPFIDWTKPFDCGNAPQDADGGSAILSLLTAGACKAQADLENQCGLADAAGLYRDNAEEMISAVGQKCLDADTGMVADTAGGGSYSVHAQVFAVLFGLLDADAGRRALEAALGDEQVTQIGTLYFQYYLAQALRRVGAGERFHRMLDAWRGMLTQGLTTWPESLHEPRSDCHAWSVTASIELIQTVAGFRPADDAVGFDAADWDPALGELPEIHVEVPTPRGRALIHLERQENGSVLGQIHTPVPTSIPHIPRPLPPGDHKVRFEPGGET
ncbi:MAG: hypothetical protein ACP5HU_11190 [Phycisphaerae bacterium]